MCYAVDDLDLFPGRQRAMYYAGDALSSSYLDSQGGKKLCVV